MSRSNYYYNHSAKPQPFKINLTQFMTKYKILNTNNLLNDGWAFATVNNHFAEIYFKKGFGIWGHAYEDKSSFKTKKEKDMIKKDLKKYHFTYRNGFYFDKINKLKTKIPDKRKVFPESK